jgi:hypothetical protein
MTDTPTELLLFCCDPTSKKLAVFVLNEEHCLGPIDASEIPLASKIHKFLISDKGDRIAIGASRKDAVQQAQALQNPLCLTITQGASAIIFCLKLRDHLFLRLRTLTTIQPLYEKHLTGDATGVVFAIKETLDS